MFKKILIANRGEIACRIIRTAKVMGINTVAVYSMADENSLHVRLADEAFCIGEPKVQASYLNIEAIISAAIKSEACAIHPGYGFLSENPDFATRCEEEKIVFIGPNSKVMQIMASKQLAKHTLSQTNVPLTPGYHGSDQSDKALVAAAQKIGFPLLIKAAFGGGGKGMRTVYDQKNLLPAIQASRREAQSFFGNDLLILEKLITNPRHIEVQIVGDNYGNVIHLFERDCSLQRRHQKIIEEAPAPHIDAKLRKKLTTAACTVAQTIAYTGAGTVEFIMDEQQNVYFMEMNTRLQVEHPVTEMITGLDLVSWQIKIAAGEPLTLTQKDIKTRGHAIECRIYAEDPEQQFIPSIGKINFLQDPQGEGLRIDSGITVGSVISMHYDPMLGKLIAHGDNRNEAANRLFQALGKYAIGGIKTNIAFLRAVLDHPVFKEGKIKTNFLENEKISWIKPDYKKALLAAGVWDYLKLYNDLSDPLLRATFAWQPNLRLSWIWRYKISDKIFDLEILSLHAQQCQIIYLDQKYILSGSINGSKLIIHSSNETLEITINQYEDKISCFFPEGVITLVRHCLDSFTAEAKTPDQLTSPMPATIVAILKKKGDKVKQGDKLVILEAMKMEHTIHATRDGVLKDIYYDVGSQVPEGVELIALAE